MIENEIYIMRSCNHPNIVKLYEEFETQDEVYLITDLVKVFIRVIYINSLVLNLYFKYFF
jgi:serine/threonine protein kinase